MYESTFTYTEATYAKGDKGPYEPEAPVTAPQEASEEDYTPTDSLVRGVYSTPQTGLSAEDYVAVRAEREAMFDRWMAQHDAEVEQKVQQSQPAPVTQPDNSEAVQEISEDLRRVSAEYKNYRARAGRDKDNAKLEGIQSVFSTLVPTLDALSAAAEAGDLDPDSALGRIHANMITALEEKGLTIVAEEGVDFDPTVHEAVMKQEVEGMEPEKVAKVLRAGFVTEFAVIRAATVIVSG